MNSDIKVENKKTKLCWKTNSKKDKMFIYNWFRVIVNAEKLCLEKLKKEVMYENSREKTRNDSQEIEYCNEKKYCRTYNVDKMIDANRCRSKKRC